MLVAIHQPHYLPWLGYIDKAERADLFVLLDHVDFDRGGWQNRNYVMTAGGPRLLSVPTVHYGGRRRIDRTEISPGIPWRRKHLATIEQAYATAPYLPTYRDALVAFYSRNWETVAELGCGSVQLMLDLFGVTTPLIRSSSLSSLEGHKTALLVEICSKVGASVYLTGDGAAYLDHGGFADAGIRVQKQQFSHPRYPQARGRGHFTSHLACVDLLLNAGPSALRTLRNANGR